MLKSTNKEKGFTIIEVVLVLAIAGLIFLVVFLALPALQKSQRDTARRQDVGKVVAGVQQYMADNGKRLPGRGVYVPATGYWAGLAQATHIYIRSLPEACPVTSMDYAVVINEGCTCNSLGTGAASVSDARYAAINIKLESGANYCQDV